MFSRFERRDNSVKQRHKDAGLVVHVRCANRRERHTTKVVLETESAVALYELQVERALDRVLKALFAEVGL